MPTHETALKLICHYPEYNLMPAAVKTGLSKVNEVGLTYTRKAARSTPVVRSQDVAVKLLRSVWDANKIELVEEFKVMLLDASNSCLGIAEINTGGLDYCTVDTRVVFATALAAKATQIILAHNHPSGNLTISESDKRLTKKICEGGAILDIQVLDHFILTKKHSLSLASEGLMPTQVLKKGFVMR